MCCSPWGRKKLDRTELYNPWNSPGQNIGVGSLSLSTGDLPNPGIEPRSPALEADSLPAEPQGKLITQRQTDPITRQPVTSCDCFEIMQEEGETLITLSLIIYPRQRDPGYIKSLGSPRREA